MTDLHVWFIEGVEHVDLHSLDGLNDSESLDCFTWLFLFEPCYWHAGDVSGVSLGFLFHHMLFWVSVSFREMFFFILGKDSCGVSVLKAPSGLFCHFAYSHLGYTSVKRPKFVLDLSPVSNYWYMRYWRQWWCWDLISDAPTPAHFLPMSAMMWRETPPLCSGLLVDLLNFCKWNHNDSYFWWLILCEYVFSFLIMLLISWVLKYTFQNKSISGRVHIYLYI